MFTRKIYTLSICCTIFFLLITLLITTLLLTSLPQEQARAAIPTPMKSQTSNKYLTPSLIITNDTKKDTLIYNNSFSGVSLTYPVGWKDHTNRSYVEFIPLLENNTEDRYARISINNHTMSGLNLKELVSDTIQDLKKDKKDFHLIDLKQIHVNKIPGYELFYWFRDGAYGDVSNKIDFNETQILVSPDNNTSYEFIYSAEESRYHKYLPAVKKMLGDLHIKFQENQKSANLPGLRSANFPGGLAFNPITDELYVANFGSNTLSVIDTKANKAIKNVTVGSKPNDVAVNPTDNVIYVANYGSDTISVIDGTTLNITATIPVGSGPTQIAVDSDQSDRLAFVTNRNNNTVSVISGESSKKIKDIPVGKHSAGIDVNALMNRVYVSNHDDSTISIIDYFLNGPDDFRYNSTVIPMHFAPGGITVDSSTNRIFVTYNEGLSILSGSTYKTIKSVSLTLGGRPGDKEVLLDPSSHTIFVLSPMLEGIYAIDNKTEAITPIDLGYIAADIVIDPRADTIYVSAARANSVYAINATSKNTMVGITFSLNPTDAGRINCNGKNHSDNDYAMYDFNTTLYCKAETNDKFEFISWGGSVVPNTNIDTSNSEFNLIDYGTLNANFERVEPQLELSKELRDILWALIIGVIISPIAAWFIQHIFEGVDKKRQLRYLNIYIERINDVFEKNHQNKGECVKLLEEKHRDILALLKGGLITDSTFRLLEDRISEYVRKVASQT